MTDQVVTAPQIDESKLPDSFVEFSKLRQSGELPMTSVPDKTPEGTPADAPKEAEKKAEAESETASDKPQEQDEEHRVPKWRFDQELAKKRQLKEELDKVKAELETIRAPKDVKPPAPASKAETSEELEPPKFPDEADYDNWEAFAAYKKEYPKLMAQFTRALAESERKKAIAEIQQRQQAEASMKVWNERVAKAKQDYQDFDTTVIPAATAIVQDADIPQTVKDFLDQSDAAIDLMHEIGKDQASLQDFIDTAKRNPSSAIRKAAMIEASLQKPEVKAEAKPAPEPEKPKPSKPKPPETVAARASSAFDVNDDSMNPEEWARRRTADRRAKGFNY